MAGENTFQEGQKLLFDAFKHLTTLSTGSVLLLATLLKDIFKQSPKCTDLVPLIFISFTLAAVASTLVLFLFGHSVVKKSKPGKGFAIFSFIIVALSGVSFLTGICLLSIFSVANFLP